MYIEEEKNPELYRVVNDTNLLRQYDYLRYLVEVALTKDDFIVDHSIVKGLNNFAVTMLCEHPGVYRKCPIYITNCPHTPPTHEQVQDLMQECLEYVANNWGDKTPTHLAAYMLWRLNWIHPFEEGNGRTARATCYLILCLKYKMWLPGKTTIPMQIRANREPYYEALREADRASANGKVDVSRLDDYLQTLLTQQLTSMD